MCTSLTSFPALNLNKMSGMLGGYACFWDVTLPTSIYSEILIDLAANNPNVGVNFHGGNSKYNSSAIVMPL
jgi:hypothetical protein